MKFVQTYDIAFNTHIISLVRTYILIGIPIHIPPKGRILNSGPAAGRAWSPRYPGAQATSGSLDSHVDVSPSQPSSGVCFPSCLKRFPFNQLFGGARKPPIFFLFFLFILFFFSFSFLFGCSVNAFFFFLFFFGNVGSPYRRTTWACFLG